MCFNDMRASGIYSTHYLDLKGKGTTIVFIFFHSQNVHFVKIVVVLSSVSEKFDHQGFRAKYTMFGWKADGFYGAKNQTIAFNKKFVPFTDPEINNRNFFSRNHFTPHADLMSIIHKNLTYFLQNSFPGLLTLNFTFNAN